jgi:hypothetical protein
MKVYNAGRYFDESELMEHCLEGGDYNRLFSFFYLGHGKEVMGAVEHHEKKQNENGAEEGD